MMIMLVLVLLIGVLILSISRFKLNTFLALFGVAVLLGMSLGLGPDELIKVVKGGFGHTLEKIGLLIIFGVILGEILKVSKATEGMAAYILNLVGTEKSALAILLIGFLVGLPIFCDSGFIILSGLLYNLQNKNNKLRLVLCLGGALYAVHCLVPPHPGILAAAGKLNVNLGSSMFYGLLISIIPTTLVYFWSRKKEVSLVNFEREELKMEVPKNIWRLFLPLWLPIFLMGTKAVWTLNTDLSGSLLDTIIRYAGEPVFALLLGILVALPLLKSSEKFSFNEICHGSFEKAGPILAIVAAGGMFGEMVKLAIDKMAINEYLGLFSGGYLLIGFGIAAFFKTAQGSSTVAAVSTAAIVEPMLAGLGIDTDTKRQLLLLSIGAGSMWVSHANDAYFWVISNFGKTNEKDLLKNYSPMTVAMGLVSFLGIYILSLIIS